MADLTYRVSVLGLRESPRSFFLCREMYLCECSFFTCWLSGFLAKYPWCICITSSSSRDISCSSVQSYEVFLLHPLFTLFYLVWNCNVPVNLVAFYPLVDAGKRSTICHILGLFSLPFRVNSEVGRHCHHFSCVAQVPGILL